MRHLLIRRSLEGSSGSSWRQYRPPATAVAGRLERQVGRQREFRRRLQLAFFVGRVIMSRGKNARQGPGMAITGSVRRPFALTSRAII
jgi:hypothetical protein